MENVAAFSQFIQQHRQQFSKTSQIPPVLSPTIQHSGLGVHGGMGDFVLQSSRLYPDIEWVLPLTPKIRHKLKENLQGPVASLPVELYDPVLGTPFTFDMTFYYHIDAESNSLSWLIYNKELLEPLPTLEFKNQSIYAGLGVFKGVNDLLTLDNAPLLKQVHPLLRRYIGDPSYADLICQGAIAKAIAQFLSINHAFYNVAWVHDWHFSSLAGELLLTDNEPLISNLTYIQYIHNALYQGNSNSRELADILGWPKHFLTKDFFNVHGQLNTLGGALNIIKNGGLLGKVATVSKNHAQELTTVERGAGLHHIFQGLEKANRLTGINNPIVAPPEVPIKSSEAMQTKKPVLKKELQAYLELPLDENAFTLLWTHRFTQQKQIKATLMAIEKILTTTDLNIQFMFFCDVDIGSTASDVATLKQLIQRYPRQVAQHDFQPEKEMQIAGGADCSIMASFFEPFGYAPVWVAMQGGLVITARNGGQVNLFQPEQAIWLNILPDVSNTFERYSLKWLQTPSLWFLNNESYQRQVVQNNAEEIYRGIVEAGEAFFQDRESWKARAESVQQRMMQLVESDQFSKEITALLNDSKADKTAGVNQVENEGAV